MWSHHFMANRWGNNGNSEKLYFGGLQNHCRWWLQPWNEKTLAPWKKRVMTNLDSILKSRDITLPTKVHLVKAMASHSSTLAWKIPWMEEPGRLQSMGSLRVGHDWATSLSIFTFMHWRRKWQPIPVLLPGESRGRRAWWAAVYGIAQSQTLLKWLSSSNSQSYGFFQ